MTTNLLQAFINQEKHKSKQINKQDKKDLKIFDISEFFISIKRGKCPPINSLKEGDIPVITTTESNNGIIGYYDVPNNITHIDCITISANGSSCCAFYQPYKFTANADVLVGKLKEEYNNLYFKIFLCTAIRNSAWKFTYYRKCSNTKLLKDVKIAIPLKNNQIDYNFIRAKIENTTGFNLLKDYLKE
ncbi:restriction endonuclease subunit S [Rickettsia endosymbiont of Orchestes rusci]|uniref:restriction endonuclease subunit S n=1 Tax=Rickettsia endosymbiont of Orchestes rusci TaxID=3066250 RepID=UPI00313E221E